MGLTAVRPKPWPSGDSWVVAKLSLDMATLHAVYGLDAEASQDDLDRFQFAAVEDEDTQQQLWFVEYERAPSTGVEVWVDAETSRSVALKALSRKFGGYPALQWKNEYERDPTRFPTS